MKYVLFALAELAILAAGFTFLYWWTRFCIRWYRKRTP